MNSAKIAISINRQLLAELDHLIKEWGFSSRSQAIQDAVLEKIERAKKSRLAAECAKLNAKSEQAMAEEDLPGTDEWPDY